MAEAALVSTCLCTWKLFVDDVSKNPTGIALAPSASKKCLGRMMANGISDLPATSMLEILRRSVPPHHHAHVLPAVCDVAQEVTRQRAHARMRMNGMPHHYTCAHCRADVLTLALQEEKRRQEQLELARARAYQEEQQERRRAAEHAHKRREERERKERRERRGEKGEESE